MPILDAQGLHKTFGEHVVLESVSLTIRTGERVGLLGINGSGKSTLAKILTGEEPHDGGVIAVRRGARVAHLPQAPKFEGPQTAIDHVLDGLSEWRAARKLHADACAALEAGEGDIDHWLNVQESAAQDVERLGGWEQEHLASRVLQELGIRNPEQAVSTMSGGEGRRVALARILVSQPDLAILDEPTNHLDVDSIEWLENFLVDSFKGALLLVTHDRFVLDHVAQRTLELEQGRIHSYDGGYQRYLEEKAERTAQAERVEANRQNFLRRELEWLRKRPKARTTKSKARIDRAHEALAQRAPEAEQRATLQLESARLGKTILDAKGVALEVGGRRLVNNFSLHLTSSTRLGVVGPNGCGKTTLLRGLLGELPVAAGEVTLGKNTKVAYLDQARGGLDPKASVLDNVAEGRGQVRIGTHDMDVRSYLEQFLFNYQKQRQPVGSLSGGERTRVALARLLSRPANLLVLDEPTNDLDVAMLGSLEELLLEFDGALMVITHDRWLLDRVANAILAPDGEGAWTLYEGDYTLYRTYRQRAPATVPPPAAKRDETASKPAPKPDERKAREKRALTYAERLELDGIEARIAEAEARAAELQTKLTDPSVFAAGPGTGQRLASEAAAAQAEVERLMARWEALESKREA
jgi:ATP-binding cassette subfamily F protein uup